MTRLRIAHMYEAPTHSAADSYLRQVTLPAEPWQQGADGLARLRPHRMTREGNPLHVCRHEGCYTVFREARDCGVCDDHLHGPACLCAKCKLKNAERAPGVAGAE